MSGLWDWIIHIPSHLAEFGTWLNTDISIGAVQLSPLAMLGIGSVAFIGVILALRIAHLVNPLG